MPPDEPREGEADRRRADRQRLINSVIFKADAVIVTADQALSLAAEADRLRMAAYDEDSTEEVRKGELIRAAMLWTQFQVARGICLRQFREVIPFADTGELEAIAAAVKELVALGAEIAEPGNDHAVSVADTARTLGDIQSAAKKIRDVFSRHQSEPSADPRTGEGSAFGLPIPDEPAVLRVILDEAVAFLRQLERHGALARGRIYFKTIADDESKPDDERRAARERLGQIESEKRFALAIQENSLGALKRYMTFEELTPANDAWKEMAWRAIEARAAMMGTDEAEEYIGGAEGGLLHAEIFGVAVRRIKDEVWARLEAPDREDPGEDYVGPGRPEDDPVRNQRIREHRGKGPTRIQNLLRKDYPDLTIDMIKSVLRPKGKGKNGS